MRLSSRHPFAVTLVLACIASTLAWMPLAACLRLVAPTVGADAGTQSTARIVFAFDQPLAQANAKALSKKADATSHAAKQTPQAKWIQPLSDHSDVAKAVHFDAPFLAPVRIEIISTVVIAIATPAPQSEAYASHAKPPPSARAPPQA